MHARIWRILTYYRKSTLLYLVRGARMQIWNNLRGNTHVLSTLFADKRYPKRPSRTRRINGLVSPPNSGNRHGVRLTAYYKVCFLKMRVVFHFTSCFEEVLSKCHCCHVLPGKFSLVKDKMYSVNVLYF